MHPDSYACVPYRAARGHAAAAHTADLVRVAATAPRVEPDCHGTGVLGGVVGLGDLCLGPEAEGWKEYSSSWQGLSQNKDRGRESQLPMPSSRLLH